MQKGGPHQEEEETNYETRITAETNYKSLKLA